MNEVKKIKRLQPKLTLEEKRALAIAWMRERNLYVLDKQTKKPAWGNGSTPK